MASAWGDSWGVSWGVSWGTGVVPPVTPPPAARGGGIKRWVRGKAPEPLRDPFDEALRAPYREPVLASVPATATFVPFAQQPIPRELGKAIGDHLASTRFVAKVSLGDLTIRLPSPDDDEIPDEVVLLALL